MTKQQINMAAIALGGVHPLVAIRYLITGTTHNCMFSPATMRRIAQAWKAYQN
jgi:hypothetical protein